MSQDFDPRNTLYSFVCIYGDRFGYISQKMNLFKEKDELPKDLSVMRASGYAEERPVITPETENYQSSPYSFLCIFGDRDGSLVRKIYDLKERGEFPEDMNVICFSGFKEESIGFALKANEQPVSIVRGEVTWPDVSSYQ